MTHVVPLQALPQPSPFVDNKAVDEILERERLEAFSEFNSALAPIGAKLMHLDGCIQSPTAAELKRLRIAGDRLRFAVGEAAFAERLLRMPGAVADALWERAFLSAPTKPADRRAA